MSSVHVILPNDIDDPATPSGGNTYDRRVCDGLAELGWPVVEHVVWGAWPQPSAAQLTDLGRVLTGIPDDAVVLIDGLIASASADVLVREADRLGVVILVHMAFGEANPALRRSEGTVLAAASAVVTTSAWSRRRLRSLYALPAERVHAATPGVVPAPVTPGSPAGAELLCVAAVTLHKGHDLLVEALGELTDLVWTCVCVGTLHRDAEFVAQTRARATERGIAERVRFLGTCTGAGLHARYATADLLVLPSRGETYGMVITEALARGIPVLATTAAAIPETLGVTADGAVPGMLVPPEDPGALAGALRRWLTEEPLRQTLRRSAGQRRTALTDWSVTAEQVSSVLKEVSAR